MTGFDLIQHGSILQYPISLFSTSKYFGQLAALDLLEFYALHQALCRSRFKYVLKPPLSMLSLLSFQCSLQAAYTTKLTIA